MDAQILPTYSLHLFAGAGGGLLADLLDGITPVAAVEIEPFPRRILALGNGQVPQCASDAFKRGLALLSN